jgi:hypothetical protein
MIVSAFAGQMIIDQVRNLCIFLFINKFVHRQSISWPTKHNQNFAQSKKMYSEVAEIVEKRLWLVNRGPYRSNLKTILARCLVVEAHDKISGLGFFDLSKRNFYKVRLFWNTRNLYVIQLLFYTVEKSAKIKLLIGIGVHLDLPACYPPNCCLASQAYRKNDRFSLKFKIYKSVHFFSLHFYGWWVTIYNQVRIFKWLLHLTHYFSVWGINQVPHLPRLKWDSHPLYLQGGIYQ